MSAIAGLIRLDGQPVDRAALQRMRELLTPYGRDAQHAWHQAGAGFVRTLLRITSEDSLDRQPLHDGDGDGRTLVLFDGRLDNRQELARALGLGAAELALMADSALALHACLRWDMDALPRLLGDFAMACWQPARRRLWLARDAMGQRPLYWHRQDGFFAFASLPKALFAVPGVPRALCEQQLHDLLCLLPTAGAQSLFQDVFRVEPGQCVLLEDARVAARRFHDLGAVRELHLPRDEDYVDAFAEQLERAVACRLRAAGPIASHLSGGWDSSTVTALAARQLGSRGQRLLAYTAVPREGFDGPVPHGRQADESPGARALAARFPNIEHVLWRGNRASPLAQLQADLECLDQAPLNPCNMVWVNGIQADAARRGARVLLTGQLGNMTISYAGLELLARLMGQGRLGRWWREARALRRRQPARGWRGLLALSVGAHLPAALWQGLQRLRGRGAALGDYTAIHPDFVERMQSRRRARDLGWDLSYRPWADGRRMRIATLGRIDAANYAAHANAAGLETRDPTADLRLVEFCLSVPESQYLRDGHTRWLLRRFMGDVLPPEITQARRKGLQAADWYEGMEAALPALAEEVQRLAAHGGVGAFLDLPALQSLLARWPQGGWDQAETIERYRFKLLRGLAAGAFIRHVDDRNA